MTGGAFGSLFAQLFHLSDPERKTLLVAGAAAGMSATFGTPVAAMLLAVELLLFEWKPRSFVPVAVAAVVAVAWRPLLMGTGVLFPIGVKRDPSTYWTSACRRAWDPCRSCLGSADVNWSIRAKTCFNDSRSIGCGGPSSAALSLALAASSSRERSGLAMTSSLALLHGSMTIDSTLRLALVKAIIWSIALGSGTSGGVLAPC